MPRILEKAAFSKSFFSEEKSQLLKYTTKYTTVKNRKCGQVPSTVKPLEENQDFSWVHQTKLKITSTGTINKKLFITKVR